MTPPGSSSYSDGFGAIVTSDHEGKVPTWTVHCGNAFVNNVIQGQARTANEHHLFELARKPPAKPPGSVQPPEHTSHASRSIRSWWLLGDVRLPRFGRGRGHDGPGSAKTSRQRKYGSESAPIALPGGSSCDGAATSGGSDSSSDGGLAAVAGEASLTCVLDKVAAALHKGMEAPARSWLSLGRDPNLADSSGNTLLHSASACGAIEVVEELLQRGAKPNLKAGLEQTALHVAVLHAQPQVASLLLRHGADANDASQNGFTPLMLCAARGITCVVPVLLEAGAAITLRDDAGLTAAMHAQAHRHKQILMLLKRHSQSLRRRAQTQAKTAAEQAAAQAKAAAGEQPPPPVGEDFGVPIH